MGLLPAVNPFGSTPIVDQMIGDAYPIVKHVSDNMDMVSAVGGALLQSNVGSPLLVQRGVVQQATTGNLGATVVTDFDDLDVDFTKILSSHVCIIGTSTGTRYFSDSGIFTATVDHLGVHISLESFAPSECANAIVQWFFIYGG